MTVMGRRSGSSSSNDDVESPAPLGHLHEFEQQKLLGRERRSRWTSQWLRTIEHQGFLSW